MRISVIATILLGANIIFGAQYNQKLSVKYATSSDAQKAEIAAVRLPNGAQSAFSSRWDDSTPAHAKMVDVFKNSGMKATFFLTKADKKYYDTVGRKILESGFAVGSHTINHNLLPMILPNDAFYETLAQRIIIESTLDTPVVAFVLPGYVADHPFYDDAPQLVGECIVRSGYLIQTGLWSDNNKKYSLPEGTLLNSHLFNINDRSPQENLLQKNVAASLAAQKRDGNPHMTLGVHSWQGDNGFMELERILTKNKNPDFWYCTQNEFAAYTLQYNAFKSSTAQIRGQTADFVITRESATNLGSDIGLEIKVSGKPLSVELDGKILKPNAKGYYVLEQRKDMRAPKKIDVVENSENLQEFNGKSSKFDGLGGALTGSKRGEIKLKIKNDTGKTLGKCEVVFRLPPYFKEGTKSFAFAEFKNGEEKEFAFTPTRGKFAESDLGDFFFAAQFDFTQGDNSGRVYFTSIMQQKDMLLPCPRDNAVFVGPVAKSVLTDTVMGEISTPAKPLADLGDTEVLKWTKCRRNKNSRSFQVEPRSSEEKWIVASIKNRYAPNFSRVVVLDFKSKAKDLTLFADFENVKSVWLNGTKIETPKAGSELSIAGNGGENRLAVEYGQSFWTTISTPLTVAKKGANVFNSVKFHTQK